METHSGDTPINRFFSFWGAISTFAFFGVLVLLGLALNTSLLSPAKEDPDDARRTALDTATLEEQALLVNTWKKNDDGTYEVPVSVALESMIDKLPQKPTKSTMPVPGTKAAEEAAAAAAAAVTAPAGEGGSTQTETNE